MGRQILFSLLFLCSLHGFSQIGIGEWRDHLSYSNAFRLAEANNRIYCATESGLFYYDRQDYSIGKISKANGLSDIGISAMAYSDGYDMLMIGYDNGNLDLISGSLIFSIPDIKRASITGDKTIYNILFIDDYAYLSCGFGIVVIDLKKLEIKETYFIGNNATQVRVNEIAFDGTNLIAATDKGIYKADINNPNLVNYQYWTRITDIPNYTKEFNTIAWYNNKLFFNYHSTNSYSRDTVYVYSPGNCEYLVDYLYNEYQYTSDTSLFHLNHRIVISDNKLFIVQDTKATRIEPGYITSYYTSLHPRDIIYGSDFKVWIADYGSGLKKASSATVHQKFCPSGPQSNSVVDISASNGVVYSVAGGVNASWGNLYRKGEVNIFKNGLWTSVFTGAFADAMYVLVAPFDETRAFVGTWNYGLVEFENDAIKNTYNESNSSLTSVIPGANYVKVGGMMFDSDQNLWMVNSGVQEPFSVKLADGTWYSFNYGSYFNNFIIGDFLLTQNNHKWAVLPRGAGLFAFDEKGTYDDMTDDEFKAFSVLDEYGKIITNDIFSIAEDESGYVWIGTNEGVLVYYNPENVFSGDNFYARKIIIEIEGSTQYLLETETVTAITIDGADRKWFGTENGGVFLLNEDGTEQILHFNTENSPLPTNNITAIAIDNSTGEVFFGTTKGIFSYRAEATDGIPDYGHVYAFPNPVRPEYTGPITITGLVTNANVKITDIAGNIVFETTALGGQAIWEGKDFSGNRVATGVYMVLCSNEDGSKTHVTKILFIN
ncbi:MAG: two-component regulator propeller domain-containing protein [Bacteroidota bacterium]